MTTSRDEITATVKEIFRDTLKVEPEKLEPQTVLKDDLNLDSLDMIEVVYELEERFDVQIPEERIKEIKTFDDVITGLHTTLEAKGA